MVNRAHTCIFIDHAFKTFLKWLLFVWGFFFSKSSVGSTCTHYLNLWGNSLWEQRIWGLEWLCIAKPLGQLRDKHILNPILYVLWKVYFALALWKISNFSINVPCILILIACFTVQILRIEKYSQKSYRTIFNQATQYVQGVQT